MSFKEAWPKAYELYRQRKADGQHIGRDTLASELDIPIQLAREIMAALNNLEVICSTSGSPRPPETACDPLDIKGKSTLTRYRDREDGVILEWVKTDKRFSERMELMRRAIAEMSQDVEPLPVIKQRVRSHSKDLLTVYPIADVHLGQLAYWRETGASSDMRIIKQTLLKSMRSLVRDSPASDTCIIANLGDFFHCDNLTGTTSRSGNVLDVDSRWSKMFLTGIYCFRKLIELALQKHRKVLVMGGPGNHDDISALSLTVNMQSLFENNKRVDITLPINPFAFHRHGEVMIVINHGEVNPTQLAMVAAADEPEMWGATRYRHALVGHRHQRSVKEAPGVVIEVFRAVASREMYAHSRGMRAGREMVAITYNKRSEIDRKIKLIDF